MTENEANILGILYEEYIKKSEANWEKVTSKRVGISRDEFEEAANGLKEKGYLPNYTKTKHLKQNMPIYFIGAPSNEAIKLFKELEENED